MVSGAARLQGNLAPLNEIDLAVVNAIALYSELCRAQGEVNRSNETVSKTRNQLNDLRAKRSELVQRNNGR
jgi:hypothetical protein